MGIGLTEFANRVGATPEAVAKAARAGAVGRMPSVRMVNDKWDFNEACVTEWIESKPLAEIYNRNALMTPDMRGGRPKGSTGAKTNGHGAAQGAPDPLPHLPGETQAQKYQYAKIQQLLLKSAIDKQRYDELAKILVKKTEVEAAGASFGAVLLQKLESIPDRHAAVLAHMNNALEIKQYLKKEINSLIEEIRKEFEYGASA